MSENEVSLFSFDSLKNFEIGSPEIKTLNDENLSECESPNNGNTKGKVQRENVTDAIIKAFTVNRRKAMIDEEDKEEDNVDYETSEQRLFILAIILASILIILATIMMSILVKQWSKTSVIIHQSPMKKESQFRLVPHLALIFNDGSMEIYEFSSGNAQLNHLWSFEVPQQKVPKEVKYAQDFIKDYSLYDFNWEWREYDVLDSYAYFGYILSIFKGDILIFNMDGNTDATVLTTIGKSSNLSHHRIRQSKVPRAILYDTKFSQAGNQLWIIGGTEEITNFNGGFLENFCYDNIMNMVLRKTRIWNLQRQTYYPGPKLPFREIGKGCPITLNRTHVLLLYNDQNKHNCLDAWMYSFEEFQWTHLNECFYAPPNSTQFGFDLMCASYLDKYMNRNILVGLKAVNTIACIGEYFDLLLLDLKTKTASIINSNLSGRSSKYQTYPKLSTKNFNFFFF